MIEIFLLFFSFLWLNFDVAKLKKENIIEKKQTNYRQMMFIEN